MVIVKHTYIADLRDYVGEEVTLHGWVYNKRSSGRIWFLILRDEPVPPSALL